MLLSAAGIVLDGIIISVVECCGIVPEASKNVDIEKSAYHTMEERRRVDVCVDTLGHELMYKVIRVEVFSF